MLTIIGGSYIEVCVEPAHHELLGSGLRAAIALSEINKQINFYSCIGAKDKAALESICNIYGITPNLNEIEETVTFSYYHPLSHPVYVPEDIDSNPIKLREIQADNLLYYGMIEASTKVSGDYVVYDPQNGISFKETGSTAKHLAIVLNKSEALHFSNCTEQDNLLDVANSIMQNEGAEVVIIKNGALGAFVFDKEGSTNVPVFKTDTVFSIGSGDIFSAIFAQNWTINKMSAGQAALLASQYTAQYCNSKALPFAETPEPFSALSSKQKSNNIYLAGPFFTMSERWLINEFRNALTEFGNIVFSPYHDAGNGNTIEVCKNDLTAIDNSDLLLAVGSNTDAGTFFEIGYAIAKGKRVVVFDENISDTDKFMLVGSGCEIITDFSTAVYSATWE